jgi:putative transposase
MAALHPKPKTGRPPKVSEAYKQQLLEAVKSDPRKSGKNFSNWSARTLVQHLASETGISVHPTTVMRLLHASGWRFRRPVRVVASPDPRYKAKRRYIRKLKRRARKGEIHLYFADEFDIELLPTISGRWMPVGQQYKVNTPGRNERHYGFGAVNYVTGELIWLLSEHKDNAAFRKLLDLLREHHQGDNKPVVIVVDNYSAHKAKKVKEWLRKHRRRFRLYLLPTYSPHLNPIERLWRHFRRTVTDNYFFGTMTALLEATKAFFLELTQNPEQVLSIVRGHA